MQKKNRGVLLIQRRMTEYRVPFFEHLRQRLSQYNITLTIGAGNPNDDEKLRHDNVNLSWGIEMPCHYYRINGLQVVWQKIQPHIYKKQDLIIMPHENSLLMNYYLLLKRRFNQIRLAFWGHGGNFQSESGGYREKMKSWSTRQVDWWFAYTSLSVDRIIKNGFPEERITCVNNSIDTDKLIEWRGSISLDERETLLKALGLEGSNVGIYIGSLHVQRRLDFLFAAASKLRGRINNFELVIIGNGNLQGEVEQFVKKNTWAKWTGALHGREKVLHMALGKVILNPGLVGLNILDSFALGIPMITTNCGIHSPEIAYLESGKNGIMTPDNLEAYVAAVERIFKDDSMRGKMASACLEDARKYTLEKMVENFTHGILQAVQHEPLRK